MASDLVVALGPATVGGITLLGANGFAQPDERQQLRAIAGGNHPPDARILRSAGGWPPDRAEGIILSG